MKRLLPWSVLLSLVSLGCGPRELRVAMNPDNNSGQSGFAVILDRGGKGITVTVETSAPAFPGPQVAHIHAGSCGEVGAVRVGLDMLEALPSQADRYGSTTEITMGTPFDTFKSGAWIINVHDTRDIGLYVSCGKIPAP